MTRDAAQAHALARVELFGHHPKVGAHLLAFLEAARIVDQRHQSLRQSRANTGNRLQQFYPLVGLGKGIEVLLHFTNVLFQQALLAQLQTQFATPQLIHPHFR